MHLTTQPFDGPSVLAPMTKLSAQGSGAGATPSGLTPLLNPNLLVCARTGLSRGTIYEVIKAGALKTVKFGSRTLVTEPELRRFAKAIANGRFADGLRGLAVAIMIVLPVTASAMTSSGGSPRINLTHETALLRGNMREHSCKPDKFYEMVEALCLGPRRYDWFAREGRAGWHVGGNATERFVA